MMAEEIEQIFDGVFRAPDPKNPNRQLIATRNLTPGRSYYGENSLNILSKGQKIELRFWDPFRSKLSAAILKGLKVFPFTEGTFCLYLGASTGTTVSHLSDIVGVTGKIFAVEVAARVARELLENIVRYRKNIIPIIADARQPESYRSVYGDISVVYSDIAQHDQTEIALANCRSFLDHDHRGRLFLVVKASSIDVLKRKSYVFSEQRKILEKSGFSALQQIDLEPFDRNHAMIIARAE